MAPCAETAGGGGSNPAPNGCSVSECANLHGARLPPPKLQECCNSYTPRTRRIRGSRFLFIPPSPAFRTAHLAQLLDRSHSTDLWQLIIVTTVRPLSRFNPGAPGAHCVHGLVAHLEPPLENHLNHLPRHRYAEVLKGHPCTPSCSVYFRSSFVAS